MLKTNSSIKVGVYLLIISAFILACIVLFGCNSNGKEASFKHSPPDTTYPACVYWVVGRGLDLNTLKRIRVDSFTWVGVDSFHQKREWARVSKYEIPITDTVRDASRKPIFDSLGKVTVRTDYYVFKPEYFKIIRDMNMNLDSLQKKFVVPAVK